VGISEHVESFRYGGSFLVPESAYLRHIRGAQSVGRADGQFITTKAHMDRMLAETRGDPQAIGQRLGTDWSTPLYRVDVHNPLLHNARLPSGFEAGANPSKFRWGGYTTGGMPEVVTDPIPQGGFSVGRLGGR
jgi:hypothetical protein